MTTESFGNLSQDEARALLDIPPEVTTTIVTDLGALTYAGNGLKLLRVKATEDGWEFVASSAFEPAIAAGSSGQYWRGDKSWQTLNAAAVGLGSVDNTADAAKNVLSATKLTTARNINGVAFDGTAPITINAVDATARIAATEKAAANGVATLDASSKIPTSQLPALAVTSTSVVNSQAAQLALTAQEGDVAVRTDQNKSYIHNGGTAGTMADWQELLTPTDTVISVNGMTGAVTVTTITGNAGTATALQTSRNIDGQGFNGAADITVIAPGTHAATSKATPVDADELALVDSAASNVLKKLTWANLKATLKTYFDTLYLGIGAGAAWTSYTPTVSSTGGAPTTVTKTADYIVVGKTVHWRADITLTAIGSASGNLHVDLPTTPRTFTPFHGRDDNTGLAVQGRCLAGAATVYIVNYNNTSLVANGAHVVISGTYESQ